MTFREWWESSKLEREREAKREAERWEETKRRISDEVAENYKPSSSELPDIVAASIFGLTILTFLVLFVRWVWHW
jgi:hypothetical protein